MIAVGIPLLFQPVMVERDLRFREIGGSLNRFYLDALLAVRAIQAHGAEHMAQAGQLRQSAQAGLRQQSLTVRAEAAQMVFSLGLVVGLVYSEAARAQSNAGLLLLSYWALSIPARGRQFASIMWNMQALRNTLLRFLEPLRSRRDNRRGGSARGDVNGVKVGFDGVRVIAAGQVIIDRINLSVAPGEHVAIVGSSGAGKSSLVGLLLGWHKPALRISKR
jgi:ATP-binding cassette subfamily B protein